MSISVQMQIGNSTQTKIKKKKGDFQLLSNYLIQSTLLEELLPTKMEQKAGK